MGVIMDLISPTFNHTLDGPLRLRVLDAGDGGAHDLTDFGDAGFITAEKKK